MIFKELSVVRNCLRRESAPLHISHAWEKTKIEVENTPVNLSYSNRARSEVGV